MITQKATFYDNYTLKSSSDYNGDDLVHYIEYNKNGLVVFENLIGEFEKRFEYDKKNRIKRSIKIDKLGNKEWKSFTYSKDNLIVLRKMPGNPTIITKMVFGPEENGERELLYEKFM